MRMTWEFLGLWLVLGWLLWQWTWLWFALWVWVLLAVLMLLFYMDDDKRRGSRMTFQVSDKREVWQKIDDRFEAIGYYKEGFVMKECCLLLNDITEKDVRFIREFLDLKLKYSSGGEVPESSTGDREGSSSANAVKTSGTPKPDSEKKTEEGMG